MTAQVAVAQAPVRTDTQRGTRLVLLGGLCGLAWAAGLRGWIIQLAGAESTFSWLGTVSHAEATWGRWSVLFRTVYGASRFQSVGPVEGVGDV